MRFVHRTRQCYVVGEGSFVGECGDLSMATLMKGDDEDSGGMSVFSLTSPPSELRVAVDLEPSHHEPTSTSSSSTEPSDEGSQYGHRSLSGDGISPFKAVSGGEVVCEDGEL